MPDVVAKYCTANVVVWPLAFCGRATGSTLTELPGVIVTCAPSALTAVSVNPARKPHPILRRRSIRLPHYARDISEHKGAPREQQGDKLRLFA